MFQRAIAYVQITAGAATGSIAGSLRVGTVVSPAFYHPRTLMGDFVEAERSIRKVLEQFGLRRWYMTKPAALVHLVPPAQGVYEYRVAGISRSGAYGRCGGGLFAR